MVAKQTVSPERWAQIQNLFHATLAVKTAERELYLDSRCGSDLTLRRHVQSLLDAHSRSGPLGILPDESIDRDDVQLNRLKETLADRYQIRRTLGVGGMATVYLATDLRHNRNVAIKVLRPELFKTLGAERFLREIAIAASLRHPNILPLFDSNEVNGVLYYVMPVENESLRQRLVSQDILPLDQAMQMACETLDALHYAHSEGVVHRDIKPENILLSRGHAIVADFGIARAISAAGGDRVTQAGVQIGTPAYMSPEQLWGDPAVDGRSDIYSLGCVMFEMLAGRPPMPAWTSGDPGLDELSAEVPLAVVDAIRTALAMDPAARFETAAEFAGALKTAQHGTRTTAQPRMAQSIAVLPFANLSADPENEYLSDGMTEEIINALTQLEGLRVAARTSSFMFKGRTQDVADIGAKLNVATVLEGSVRQAGNRLRITAQLIDSANGYHLWSERFDREMDDVFAIQDEIASAIADRLKVTLSDQRGGKLAKPPTRDLQAYQLYLKGRHRWNERTKDALRRSVEYFEMAIQRDAEYAEAYAGLADAYLLLRAYGHLPREDALEKAKAAADRALELDDSIAEAHASRGQILRAEFDWQGEEAAYCRALELNPNYPTARQWYSTLLAALGRHEEALAQIKQAEELDPLSHAISVTVATVLFFARDFDAALAQLQKTRQMEPNFFSTHAWLGIIHAQLGNYELAEQAVNRAAELNPDNPNVLVGLAYAYARAGRREEALEVVHRAEGRGALGWHGIIYAELGMVDQAFEVMERAFEEDQTWNSLYYLKGHPWFQPLRKDPRFLDLLRRLNFPITDPAL